MALSGRTQIPFGNDNKRVRSQTLKAVEPLLSFAAALCLSFPKGICVCCWCCDDVFFGHEFFPGWVGGLDEGDLLGSGPVFKFFLAGYGVADVLELFGVDQPCDFVRGRVCAGCLLAVLGYAGAKVVGDADVERVGAVGKGCRPRTGIRVSALWLLLGFVAGAKRRFPSGMTTIKTRTVDYSFVPLPLLSWGISVPLLRVSRPVWA